MRGDRVLDAACGTGDLAIADLKAGAAKVTGLDFSEAMLARARKKTAQRTDALEWVQGDMLALPFADGTFDAATVGFGVRNVADLELGLRELRRVLRPGGRVAILEITQPRGAASTVLLALVRPRRSRARQGASRRRRLHLPAGVGEEVPGRRDAGAAARASAASATCASGCSPDRSWRCTRERRRVSRQLAQVHATPGVAAYMAEVEAGLARAVAVTARARAGGGRRGALGGRQAAAPAALLSHRRG